MRPGQLWMVLHFGRPPTDFQGMDGPFADPLIRISREGGRTWGEESPMGLTWTIDGFMSDGGKSVLRLQSGKILFVSHRHGSTYLASGSHGIPAISESTDDGKTWSPARVLGIHRKIEPREPDRTAPYRA